MKCPKCDTDNVADSKYCKECATSLTGEEAPKLTFTKTMETPYHVVEQGTVFAGRYEILEKIGEGGMGEVYRALDQSLDRQVAVKILPPDFAKDKERLARFEREAKLLAVLNHTNIAAIHGLEQTEGRRFLVLELVEGETLRSKLDRNPLEIEEALDLCRQVAEGLESAHEKGIVHRDLKPSNIMVTPEGTAKILDFGLAKAFAGETTGIGIDIEKSPTITAQMTKPGMVLGTAAYMSPEQARGRAVDKRTDIWAFGCVLFECLTGMRAFEGETISDNLAFILRGEPDWKKLPGNTPAMIRILLRRCLQRDPRKRLHDMADARIEIEEIGFQPIEEATVTKRFTLGWILAVGAVGILIGLLIGIIVIKSGGSSLSPTPITSVIKVESGHSLDGRRRAFEFNWPNRTAMTISKNGRFIVYCAVSDDAGPEASPQLFLRELGKMEAEPIPGSEGGIAPFLSPDDRWIGFFTDGMLKKVPVEGGVTQDLCEASLPYGASWGDDESIVFNGVIGVMGLLRISSQGGEPEILTEPDPEQREYSHRLPFHLPNGKGVLFTIMRNDVDIEPRIAVLESDAGKWRTVLEDASDARYIPTGHLVFLRRGTLMAVAFDMRKLEISGQPVPVITDVMHILNIANGNYNTGKGQYHISDSGSLVFVPGSIIPNQENSLVWLDQKGNETPIGSHTKAYSAPRLSPDGQKIVYLTSGTDWCIWAYDIARDIHRQVVTERTAFCPIWTPDGNRIVFGWSDSYPENIYSVPTDGSTVMKRLTTSPNYQVPCSFSLDGNLLTFLEWRNSYDIFIYDFRDITITPFATEEYNEFCPEFSPDGRWIAYCTRREGRYEVFIRPSSGTGEIKKVSREGGIEPLWARSGKQIFYRWGRQMWAADIRTEPNFSVGSPLKLFEKSGLGFGEFFRGYDISLDDQLFLMVREEEREPQPVTEMILIQNWFEELKRLVPTER
jgi:serine/threonine protein kinase